MVAPSYPIGRGDACAHSPEKEKHMTVAKQPLMTFFAGLITAAVLFTAPGIAWSSVRDEIQQFHVFLREHPKVSTDLRMNPNLVNNRKYLEKHDDLEKFLKRHPAVKNEILRHPGRVFSR
jgi:hypothetical protein